MIDKAALFKQLMQVFLGELDEHVRLQNRQLLELEKASSEQQTIELVRELLRSAHSLKGAAHAVGLPSIETLCHHVEELLGQVVAGNRPLDKPLFELLFASVDSLDDAGKRLRDGATLDDAPIARVSSRLTAAPPPMSSVSPDQPAPTLPLPRPVSLVPPTLDRTRTIADSGAGHVRVASNKLDKLLTQASELNVARSHLDARDAEVQALTERLVAFRAEWQRIERPLGKLLEDERASGLPISLGRSFERARGLLQQLEREVEQLAANMRTTVRTCHGIVSAIDADVKSIRMLPFSDVCTGISRAVRDMAQERGKDVDVVIQGGDVELDRYILEGLKDPLVHLARNAVDHGIEPSDVRVRQGKPARGRIEIAAMLLGAQVEITVTDDGAGLDEEAIVRHARERRFVADASSSDAAMLIFLPGFSTSSALTLTSGRGVGLDVVKSRVESLHGQVSVESKAGRGVRFSLVVPLTVTSVRAVVVEVGDHVFAFPSMSVERMARFDDADVRWVEGRPMLLHAGALVDIAPVSQLLSLSGHHQLVREDACLVVISGRGQVVALVVDRLLLVDDILVKNLGRRLRRVRYVGGATVLAGGKIALILSPGEIVAAFSKLRAARGLALPFSVEPDVRKPAAHILVVDDSPTTRTMSRSILETAGFVVTVAIDGQDALRILEEKSVDLVLTDVEMPRMDGITLTQSIRSSRTLSKLPVVIMTGLGSDRDKARGLEAGADAYLIKSAFDKDQLLDVISQLL